jgi:hypothetical protein
MEKNKDTNPFLSSKDKKKIFTRGSTERDVFKSKSKKNTPKGSQDEEDTLNANNMAKVNR